MKILYSGVRESTKRPTHLKTANVRGTRMDAVVADRQKLPPTEPDPNPEPKPDPEPEPGADPDLVPGIDPLPEPMPM